MEFFKQKTAFDFMGKRKMFASLSIGACVASLILTFTVGPKLGIDFAGGTEMQVRFQGNVGPEEIRQALAGMGHASPEVINFGSQESEYLIRMQAISPITEQLMVSSKDAFAKKMSGVKVAKFEFSPGGDKVTVRISKQLPIADVESALSASGLKLGTSEAKHDAEAVKAEAATKSAEIAKAGDEDEGGSEEIGESKRCEGVSCTWPQQGAFVYETNLEGVAETVMKGLEAKPFGKGAIKLRAEWVGAKVGAQLRNAGALSLLYAALFIMLYIAIRFDLRFAPGAVVALVHDVIITLGICIIARVELTLGTVAACLTIVGYSVNDTIVVFDRIRENLAKIKERALVSVINQSINETLSRTILTALTTELVLVVLLILGWKTNIRDFAFALTVGIIIGTYSSIFIASPIVVWIDQHFFAKKSA